MPSILIDTLCNSIRVLESGNEGHSHIVTQESLWAVLMTIFISTKLQVQENHLPSHVNSCELTRLYDNLHCSSSLVCSKRHYIYRLEYLHWRQVHLRKFNHLDPRQIEHKCVLCLKSICGYIQWLMHHWSSCVCSKRHYIQDIPPGVFTLTDAFKEIQSIRSKTNRR